MKSIASIFFTALFLILLQACTQGSPDASVPDLTFAQMQPISLDVAKIEFVDAYRPPMMSPNVEHLFLTTPMKVTRDLVARQLVAAGTRNVLRVMLDDASVVSEELPMTRGLWGAFAQEPAERYKAKVSLRFELVDSAAPDVILGHAEVIAKQNKTLFEGISIAERDRAYLGLMEDLMDNVSDGFATVVRSTFGMK